MQSLFNIFIESFWFLGTILFFTLQIYTRNAKFGIMALSSIIVFLIDEFGDKYNISLLKQILIFLGFSFISYILIYPFINKFFLTQAITKEDPKGDLAIIADEKLEKEKIGHIIWRNQIKKAVLDKSEQYRYFMKDTQVVITKYDGAIFTVKTASITKDPNSMLNN